jgi:broad-specificity NMP kinase
MRFGVLVFTISPVAKRNYLVEGGSGTGKSAVCRELRKRGYRAVDGDNELAYQGDPETGRRTDASGHEYHIWDVDKVREIAANTTDEVAFFCGGSRNFGKFLDVFDEVIVLDVDTETLKRRLADRAADDWGGNEQERELILRLHATKEDIPEGTVIDTARPLDEVVDAILEATRTEGACGKYSGSEASTPGRVGGS